MALVDNLNLFIFRIEEPTNRYTAVELFLHLGLRGGEIVYGESNYRMKSRHMGGNLCSVQ